MNHSTPFKARPTTYKGIEMRSRTEAAYAARLDAAGLSWTYEPRCFADQTGQYLPDFRIVDRGQVVYIEVKGALTLEEVRPVQKRMEIIWSSEPKAMLVISITSSGDSFHSHPDEPGEWFHQNPSRWSETKPAPVAPMASDRLALASVRQAGKPPSGARQALGGVKSAAGPAGARLALGGLRTPRKPSPDGLS